MFTKGKSGNPAGRPKRDLVTSHIERELLQVSKTDPTATKARKIAEKVVELAETGHPWAVQFVTERTEGKPDQHVSISGSVKEISDADLADIATGSSAGTSVEASSAPAAPGLH